MYSEEQQSSTKFQSKKKDATIQQKMREGYIGKVLSAINNTEAEIGRQQISFPRIAVFGDESTGKSSLLESICKIPFPRGSQVTTKCPTQVRLQHKPGKPFSGAIWSAGVEGQKQRNRREFSNPDDITDLISEIQGLELKLASKRTPGVEASFTDVPITISIEGDEIVDLTLVDLPGFIQRERLNQSGQTKDVDRVRNTLIEYMEDPRTIFLVVVPANSNLRNANIVSLLEKFESDLDEEETRSFRARIIYCLTKCDLVGEGPQDEKAPQDIAEILSNQGPFSAIPHGWYGIVSNASKSDEKDLRRRLELDREREMSYFETHEPYCQSDILERCGTHRLVSKLSSLLAQEILKRSTVMLSETDKALHSARAELKALGPPPTKEQNALQEFDYIIQDIKKYFEKATNGEYESLEYEAKDISLGMKEKELEKCKLGYRRKTRIAGFKDQIRSSSLDFNSESQLLQLQKAIAEGGNGKFESTVPNPEILFEQVRRCIERWRAFAESLCDDIASAAILCLNVIVDIKTSKYAVLPGILKDYFGKMIEEQKGRAMNRLEWLYVDEAMRPDSINDSFIDAYKKLKNPPGLGADDEKTRETYVANLISYIPVAEARYIDNAIRTVTTHIFDVPIGEKRTRVASERIPPKYPFLVSQILGGRSLADMMKLRDDVHETRLRVNKKISALKGLRDALLMQDSNVEFTANGNGLQNNITEQLTMSGSESED